MKNVNAVNTETLVKIVKCLTGYETWYRIEETGKYVIRFTERPLMKREGK